MDRSFTSFTSWFRVGWPILLLLAQGCASFSKWSPQYDTAILPPTASRPTGRGEEEQNASLGKVPLPGSVTIHAGEASWYGPGFNGKKTASGEIFDDSKLTAAHKTLPLGSKARVTNVKTGESVEVEINDRGPFAGGRVIDLSKAAARALGIVDSGTAHVRIEALSDSSKPPDRGRR